MKHLYSFLQFLLPFLRPQFRNSLLTGAALVLGFGQHVHVNAQTRIAFQGFEPGDCWNSNAGSIVQAPGAGVVGIININQRSGVNALRLGGGSDCASSSGNACVLPTAGPAFRVGASTCNNLNGNTFETARINVAAYADARLTAYTRSLEVAGSCTGTAGLDANDTIHFDISRNGGPYVREGFQRGNSNLLFNYGTAPSGIGVFQYTVPTSSCTRDLRFRLRITSDRGDEMIYVDDVELTFTQGQPITAQPSTVCVGEVVTFRASQCVIDDGNWSFQWTLNGVDLPGETGPTLTRTIGALGEVYRVRYIPLATAQGAGCVLPAATSPPAPLVINNNGTITISPAGPITACLNQDIPLTASGATTYTWAPAGEFTPATGSSVVLRPSVAGSRTYTVTGPNVGCTATVQVNVSVIPVPVLDFVGTPASACSATPAVLQVNGATSYIWQPATGLNNPAIPNPTLTFTTATPQTLTYTVQGNTSGCTSTAQVSIAVNPRPTVGASSSASSVCSGSPVTLTASGATGYLWNPGNLLGSPVVVTPGSTTTYTVTGTDGNGCTNSATAMVTVSGALNVAASVQQSCFAQSPGSIDQTVSGGSGGYTFVWNDNLFTEDRINLNPGTYSVTICDASIPNCCVTRSYVINSPAAITIQVASVENVRCRGGADGVIEVTASGGAGNYTYTWNNTTQTTARITNLTAGTYCVTVTDQNGCSNNRCIIIEQPLLPLAAVITNNTSISCNGRTDGSLTATGIGGTPLYAYAWSNGQNSSTATNLAPGTYSVTISDINSCTATVSAMVTQPPVMNIGLEVIRNVSCTGANDGLIYVDVSGGNIPYTYDWAHILGGNDPEDVEGLSPGVYQLNVVDSRGCRASRTFNIIEPAPLQVILNNALDIACKGQSTGFIDIGVLGGTPDYTYSWTRNGVPLPQTTQDLFGLNAGGYIVVVRDANDCSATLAVNLTEPAPFILTQNFLNNVRCFGQSNGSVGYDASGGTPPYSFLWSTGSPIEDIRDLSAGTYCLTATDARGCRVIECATITQPQPLAIVLNSLQRPACSGQSTGAIDIGVTGGVAPYTFNWTNLSQAEDQVNLAPGTYCVTARDANDCIVSRCIDLTSPGDVAVQLVNQANNGCPGQTNGSLTISVSGGTPFPAEPFYTYRWTRNGVFYSTAQNQSLLLAGEYCVSATDANGCIGTACYTITDPTPLQAQVTAALNPSCHSASTGSISITIQGGTQPYTTTWTGPGGFSSNQPNIAGLRAGSYNLLVVDANSCNTTLTVELTEPSPVTVQLRERRNVRCFNGSDGFLEVIAFGGTGTYSYRWSRSPADLNASLTNLLPGTYSVTVTDQSGCSAVLSNLTITQPAAALALRTTEKRDLTCNGANNGRISVEATGGTLPYTFLWTTGDANVTTIQNLAPGDYCVTVTDANGCTQDQCEEIIQPSVFEVRLISQQNPSCAGTATGAIVVEARGGVIPYTLTWSNINPQPLNPLNPTNLAAGTYTLTATDANGCQRVLPVTLPEAQPIQINVSRRQDITCANGNNGAIELEVTGGSGNYSYLWSTGALTPVLNNLIPGTYTVTVSDQLSCTATTSVTLVQLTPLTFTLLEASGTGCGGLGSGLIRTQATGGTTPYTYRWNHDPNLNAPSAAGLAVGCYDVTVTDANSCSLTLSACIAATPPVIVEVLSVQPVTCAGQANGRIDIRVTGGTAPYSITWLPDNVQNVQSRTGLSGGTYFVVASDRQNCFTVSAPIVVDEPDALTFTQVFLNQPRCNGLSDGSIGVFIEGGTQPYSYRWDNGSLLQQQNNLATGTYCVTVTDARGCILNRCIELRQPQPIRFPIDQLIPDDCTGSGFGAIELTVTGGTQPYNYVWDNGDITEDLANLREGRYCLRVLDFNGCGGDTCINVPRAASPTVAVDPAQPTTFCSNAEPIELRATPVGGRFSGPGVVDHRFFDPALAGPGIHRITYEGDEFGCEYSGSFELRVDPAPNPAEIRIGNSPVIPEFCSNNNALYLTFFTPVQPGVTGVISGPGILRQGNSYRFNPSVAGPGVHTLVLELTSTNGCTRRIETTVTVGLPFVVNLTSSAPSICAGDEVTLTATGADRYTWGPTSRLSCSPSCANIGPEVLARPATTTTFTVTGVSGGCVATASVRVEVRPVAPIRATANRSTICQGESVTVTATSTDAGYSYIWSDGLNDLVGNPQTFEPQVTTTFTVTGIHPSGCTARSTVRVQVNPTLVLASANPPVICRGSSTVLNASSTQPGIYNFFWSPAVGLNSSLGGSVVARPLQTTTYTVVRSGAGSCRSATVTVTVNATDVQVQVPTQPLCQLDACIPLVASIPGGTWNGEGVLGNSFCPQVSGPGLFTLTYSGVSNGCSYSQVASIRVNAPATARISNWKPLHCRIGTPFVFETTSASAVITGPGMLADGRTFIPELAGDGIHALTVNVPPGSACAIDTTYQVEVRFPNVSLTGLLPVYCGNSAPVQLVGSPAGGTYTISGGARPGSLTGSVFNPAVAGPGLYFITYYGVDGPCVYSTTQPVRVTGTLSAAVSTVNPNCPSCPDGRITLTVSGGTSPYTHLISNQPNTPPTSPIFTGLLPGTYNLEVRDAGGCTQILTATLQAGTTNPELCNAPRSISVDITREGDADVSWEPVPNAEGYEVEYRLQNAPQSVLQVVQTNRIVIEGLLAASRYELVIRTRCSENRTSPNSETVLILTDLPEADCPRPVITSLTPTTNNLLVSWGFANNSSAYEVSWRLLNSNAPFSSFIVGSAVSQYLIENLLPTTAYEVRLRNICGSELSAYSPSQTATTLEEAAPCDVPVITGVAVGQTSAVVNWSPAAGADRYTISWRRQQVGAPWVSVTLNSAAITTFQINNLLPGTGYEVRVRSRCGNNLSGWSPVRTFVTLGLREMEPEASSAFELRAYPNPTRGLLTIEMPSGLGNASEIHLYDLQSRLVASWKPESDQTPIELDLTGLAEGIYLLRVNSDQHQANLRLVLQR
jgi:hypothetical protein